MTKPRHPKIVTIISEAPSSPPNLEITFEYVSRNVTDSPNKICLTKFFDAPPITINVATLSKNQIIKFPKNVKIAEVTRAISVRELTPKNSRPKTVQPIEISVPIIIGGAAIKTKVQKLLR